MEEFVPPSKLDAMDTNKMDEMGEGFTSKKIDGFSAGNPKSDSDSGDSDSESAHNKSDSIEQMFSASLKAQQSQRVETQTLVRTISFAEILSSGEQYHDMVLRCNGESAGIPVHRQDLLLVVRFFLILILFFIN